jgi:hypothetical protein
VHFVDPTSENAARSTLCTLAATDLLTLRAQPPLTFVPSLTEPRSPSIGRAMRRVLAHPLAPVVGAALAALAYVAVQPATADMAAHAFRAWLFDTEGMTVWNAQWYGGHHVLGYSTLFAPLAAWPGPAWSGALAAVAATAAFAPIARAAAPSAEAAAAATWLFAAGVLSNVVIGRMPFTLGIALAVTAWLCARPDRRAAWRVVAGVLSLACVLASPVAGAFLALAALALALARGREAVGRAAVLALPVAIGGAGMYLLFPEGGDDRFVATAFWPMLLVVIAATALVAPGRRSVRVGAVLYIAILVAAFVVPTPFGQNALRLPVLIGPALLLIAPRAGAPRAAIAVVLAALLYLQWLPAVRAVAEARGDPSTEAAFFDVPREFLSDAVEPGERVEVAFTHNHWEVAHLATAVPLARGWERQLDEKANPLFYDGRPLTAWRYHSWLRDTGVHWVALPDAPLDYSAEAEARLLKRGLPYLRPAHEGGGWRIWEVRDPSPPASDGARVTAAGPDGFEVESRGTTVVRQRWTRWWRSDGACVSRAPGGWTRVTPVRRGPVRVRAELEADGGPECSTSLAGH